MNAARHGGLGAVIARRMSMPIDIRPPMTLMIYLINFNILISFNTEAQVNSLRLCNRDKRSFFRHFTVGSS